MYWSEQIGLVVEFQAADDQGYRTAVQETTLVYADAINATRAEFYAAMQAGQKVDMMFRVWETDWEGAARTETVGPKQSKVYPTAVVCHGETYDIQRAFSKEPFTIQLTATRRA